jgi:hypothetical protein
MTTTVITQDALELINQTVSVVKDLLEVIRELKEDIEELKRITRKPLLLTVNETAELLRIKDSTLRQYMSEGQTRNRKPVPAFVRIGSKPVFPYNDLCKYVDELPRLRKSKPEEIEL